MEEAAAFTDACSGNYAHFVTEVLPRIALFCQRPEYSHVPLIVDTDLHSNMIQAIKMVVGSERRIYTLHQKAHVEVQKLHIVDPLGYIPFEWRRKDKLPACMGLFSPQALP